MNIQISRISGNSFRKAIAAVALVAAVLVGQAASAQDIAASSHKPAIENNAQKFQAVVHPIENSVSMKVHFVNPDNQNVVLSIYDQKKNLVYKKIIGREAVFHGKFDLANLPDGEYKVEVYSRKDSYSRSISIQSQQERFALAE